MAGTISKAIITSQTTTKVASISGGTLTNPSISTEQIATQGFIGNQSQLMMTSQLLNTVPQVMGMVPMTACCGGAAEAACVVYPIVLTNEASPCISFTVTGTCTANALPYILFEFYNPNTGEINTFNLTSPKSLTCTNWASQIVSDIETMYHNPGYTATSKGCVVTICVPGSGFNGSTLTIYTNGQPCPSFSQPSFTFGGGSSTSNITFNFSEGGNTSTTAITNSENSTTICSALAGSINALGIYTATCNCQTTGTYIPATVTVASPAEIIGCFPNTFNISAKIVCGSNTYTYTSIVVPGSPLQESTQIMAIVNLINYFSNTYPFTAASSGAHNIKISSTQGASQNGCQLFLEYQGYNGGTLLCSIEQNPVFSGGQSNNIVTTCNLSICAPAGSAFNGETVLMNQTDGSILSIANPTQTFADGTNASSGNNCPDCREGTYQDLYNNDLNFVLPVFCNPTSPTDLYTNDWNTWMFTFSTGYDPIASGAFQIQEYVSGSWVTVATITDSTFGIPFNQTPFYPFLVTGNNQIMVPIAGALPVPPGSTIVAPAANPSSPSTSNNYCGYALSWAAVYNKFGAGLYRFYLNGSYEGAGSFCSQSPPFCLKAFACDTTPQLMDRTVKFEMEYLGGNTGDVNPADYNHNGQGNYWPLTSVTSYGTTEALAWYDSIRFPGFFGKSTFDYTRERITYATGQVYEVRDQVQRKWNLQTGNLPQWLIDRFAAYTAMADIIWVSDYNVNNASYNIKRNLVNVNSSVTPEYQNQTRFSRIQSMQFTDSVDFIFRDRC